MTTIKVKAADLTRTALDWAVAKADNQLKYITLDHTLTHPLILSGIQSYGPSFIWSQGGPIIERESISIEPTAVEAGSPASKSMGGVSGWSAEDKNSGAFAFGPTPLIAVMRCFVASKLGDEVEIPQELL